jgi:hypothetical protein
MPRGGIVPVLAPVRGGAAASIFDPLTLTNLSLWLKGDAGTYQDSGFVTPATADGDPVGGWQDQSGNARHFAQASGASRFTLKLAANGINGRAVVRCDGVDDVLTNAVALSSVIAAGAYGLWAVYRPISLTSNQANTWANQALIADSGGYFAHVNKVTPEMRAANFDGTDDSCGVAATAGTAYGIQQRHDSGTLYLLRSGAAEASAASGNTASLVGTMVLGKSGTVGQYFNADIGEIVMMQAAPSASERTGMQSYLASRWGISW